MSSASALLSACAFRVEIDGVAHGFASVEGLVRSNTTVTYRHGLSFLEGQQIAVVPDRRWTGLTLRRGVSRDGMTLVDWLQSRDVRSLRVHLLDGSAEGRSARTWVAHRAVPVRLSAPGLDATTAEVLLDVLELLVADLEVGPTDG